MKKLISAFAAILASLAFADAASDYDEACAGFDRFYIGAATVGVLPQGGSRMSPRTGAAIRAGNYIDEMWAIEGEAGFAGDHLAFAAKALWHWWGYERLDPFFTFGAADGPMTGMSDPRAALARSTT